MPLTDLPVGESARVCALEGAAVIEKISGDGTVLCRVCGTRIALSARAAEHILVEPLRHSP